ncbi:hypothetical protein BHM03_00052891 [Ensete ventricosum]|nr:hypothetical protein BHM03_00052891 [Ensete ventricosum]
MPATDSIRAVLEIGGELQRRMQDGDVERGDGDRGDDHLAVLDAAVSLHAPGGPLRHHHLRHARPHRLRGGNSPVARRQGRLLRVPRRLPRRLHLHSESSTVRRKAEDHRARQHPKFHGVPAGGSVSGGTNCSRGADPPSLTSQSGLFGGDQLVLANPGSEVMKKLSSSKILDAIGHEWIFLTVADAVAACNFMLHTCKPSDTTSCENVV